MIGKFGSWCRFEPSDAVRFLEFRETVATGIKDIIVRHGGGGTEVSGRTLEIHRLRNGALVNVFSVSYMLRGNVTDWSPEELWRAYIQLTEAEAAFRIHKSDLKLRSVWHQKRERVEAHILVCFLSYVLWKTLARFCLRAGLGSE